MWDIANRKVIGIPNYDEDGNRINDKPITKILDTNHKNFPYKCFYSLKYDQVYVFYRQGQCFTARPHDMDNYRFERVTELDLG